jgi:toxin FitB
VTGPVVLHDLELGARLLERSYAVAGKTLRSWLEVTVWTAFSGRILPFDEAAAVQAAQWHVPDPKPINYAYNPATAFARRMTPVTRNIKDFEGMGVTLVSPWDFRAKHS